MSRKTSEEKIKLIQDLYKKGLSPMKISESTGISYSVAYTYTILKERGFNSYEECYPRKRPTIEHLNNLAQKRGYASNADYQLSWLRSRGFASLRDYHNHLAKKKGFGSYDEQHRSNVDKRMHNPENLEMSAIINELLENLEKNQSWLASYLGISRQAVSLYVQGKIMHKEEIKNKLKEMHDKNLESILQNFS